MKFVVAIYALFPPFFLAWKVDSANFYTFRMYEFHHYRLSRFSRGWPQKGSFGPFWAPEGPGPIQKLKFGRHAKTAAENGSNPVRLLKCHVRREKGPTRGPGGPSVTGRGAHVSTAGKRSGAKMKKN